LRAAVEAERPLQIIGAINAYHARMAERVGYRALYLSGGGVAAGSLGVPDLGISELETFWWTCAGLRRYVRCPCW
jgi:methylisocitrate lyase